VFNRGLKLSPGDGWSRQTREVNGNAQLACKRNQTANVIGMLVSDDDRIDPLGLFACLSQAFKCFFAAETCVDEDASALGAQKCAIAGTTACENAQLYDGETPVWSSLRDPSE
jgi:hypothetical protein